MAVDFFLNIDGIPGESQAEKNKNQIQVTSWSWGGTQQSTIGATTGSGAGKVTLSEVSLTIELDKSAPKLYSSLCKGTHTAKATLTAIKSGAGNSPFLTLDLTEVFVSHLQFSASSEVPTVSLGLTYKTASINYFMQNADGTVTNAGTSGWDVASNKAL